MSNERWRTVNYSKKNYVAPFAEQICIAQEDILTLSDGSVTATFDDGAQIGFGDFN